MSLHPAHAPLPATTRTERLLLRPLRTTDVELDYDAVMASAAQLRLWSDSEWPADDFTLAGNLADLQRHQDEHERGEAYTFTVLTPDAARCLGCVYFYPLSTPMQAACPASAAAVAVRFWARSDELTGGLDCHLLATLRQWLADEWAFDCIVYPINPLDTRPTELLQSAGLALRLTYTRSNGRPWCVYG
jgi:hypothetical protein